jgi:hypothetical protein
MKKPWKNEFVVDRPEDLDDAARRILIRTIRLGREDPEVEAKLKAIREGK